MEWFRGNGAPGEAGVQNESLRYTDQLLQTSEAPNGVPGINEA